MAGSLKSITEWKGGVHLVMAICCWTCGLPLGVVCFPSLGKIDFSFQSGAYIRFGNRAVVNLKVMRRKTTDSNRHGQFK